MAALIQSTLPQLFKIYTQQIKNLDHTDDPSNDVLLVLLTRDGFGRFTLTQEEDRRLARLDDELVKRWEILAEELPNPNLDRDRRSWWWHLDKGPQVRQEAQTLVLGD